MGKQRSLLGFIVILAIAAVVTLVQIPIQLGLDLRGGSSLSVTTGSATSPRSTSAGGG